MDSPRVLQAFMEKMQITKNLHVDFNILSCIWAGVTATPSVAKHPGRPAGAFPRTVTTVTAGRGRAAAPASCNHFLFSYLEADTEAEIERGKRQKKSCIHWVILQIATCPQSPELGEAEARSQELLKCPMCVPRFQVFAGSDEGRAGISFQALRYGV